MQHHDKRDSRYQKGCSPSEMAVDVQHRLGIELLVQRIGDFPQLVLAVLATEGDLTLLALRVGHLARVGLQQSVACEEPSQENSQTGYNEHTHDGPFLKGCRIKLHSPTRCNFSTTTRLVLAARQEATRSRQTSRNVNSNLSKNRAVVNRQRVCVVINALNVMISTWKICVCAYFDTCANRNGLSDPSFTKVQSVSLGSLVDLRRFLRFCFVKCIARSIPGLDCAAQINLAENRLHFKYKFESRVYFEYTMGCSSSFDAACKTDEFQEWLRQFEVMQLSKSEIRKLFYIFSAVDVDKSGQIGLAELLAHIDLERTRFTERIFSIFDEDGSGEIDFREFVLSLWNYCTLTKATLGACVCTQFCSFVSNNLTVYPQLCIVLFHSFSVKYLVFISSVTH